MKVWALAAWAAFMCMGASAQAADNDPCAAEMVCASEPRTVFDALHRAGMEPEMSTDDVGDPMVKASAQGWMFGVFFYGCEEAKHCDSLQFLASFDDDGQNTPQLANDWNNQKRFSQLSVGADNQLNFRYDVTTKGGLNQANFADVLDWWKVMLGDLSTFFNDDGA